MGAGPCDQVGNNEIKCNIANEVIKEYGCQEFPTILSNNGLETLLFEQEFKFLRVELKLLPLRG